MTDDFAERMPVVRKSRLEKINATAQWASATGPLGGVVLQLRNRADATRRTAQLFLWMLVATVVFGLAFYLGLPMWQSWADGREEALQETLQNIRSRTQDLDADRKALLGGGILSDGTQAPDLGYLLEDTFLDLPIDPGAMINDAIEFNKRLYALGEGGTLLRLSIESDGFEKIETGVVGSLHQAAVFKESLFIVGEEGAILKIDSESQEIVKIDSKSKSVLTDLIVHNDRLYFIGDEKALLLLSQDGNSVYRIEVSEPFDAYAAANHSGRLYLFGSQGSAFILSSDGASVAPIQTNVAADLSGAISHSSGLYLFGEDGALLRVTESNLGTEKIETGSSANLIDAIEYNRQLYFGGSDGTLRKLSSDYTRLDRPIATLNGSISSMIAHDGRVYFLSVDSSAYRLSEDGKEVRPLATSGSNSDAMLSTFDEKLYIVGLLGVSAQATSLAAAARKLPFSPNQEASESVDEFFRSLPEHIATFEPVRKYVSRLNSIGAERIGLDLVAQKIEQDTSRLLSNPLQYLRDRRALDFDAFLNTCRGDTPTPELSTACLTAWQTEQTQSQRSWWEALTAQVPPGILLLFLLATLGGLYRYNLRLAGFHESRADFLTLMAYGRTEKELRDILAKTQTDAVNLATMVLAADKVEMGAIKAKLGQAEIELARTLSGVVEAEEKKGS